jgi:predicted nucleic acid-binding protein
MIHRAKPRLFLDSNVLMRGFVAKWGLDKAILSLCAARVCKLVLAEAVRVEVERNLVRHATLQGLDSSSEMLESYRKFIELCAPELVPKPAAEKIRSHLHLIRHLSDLPVLLSAISAQPDWLLTNNTKHFTSVVAEETGLRIAAPIDFFRFAMRSVQ